MKAFPVWVVATVLCFAAAISGRAGEIVVEVKTPEGDPKEGTEIQLAMDDGEKTVPVRTNKDGVAFLAWKTDMKKGRIIVNGAAQYAGTMPLRISFKQ